jgi:hypothetical protein
MCYVHLAIHAEVTQDLWIGVEARAAVHAQRLAEPWNG